MSNCFYFAFVQHQSCLDQRLSVTGGTGVYDLHAFRKLAVDILDRRDCGAKGISVIVVIEGVEECSVLAYQCCFCRCGTGVNAEECFSPVTCQVFDRHLMLRVTRDEFLVFRVCRKERIQTFHLDFHFYFFGQTVLEFAKSNRSVLLRIERGTNGGEQV